MLYAAGAVTAAIASLYLLLRRSNAFDPDITTPRRLRRWTAAFFATLALGHLWYMPALAFTSGDDIMVCMFIGGLLDCMTAIPLSVVLLLCMLQDRRRPLWPAAVLSLPLAACMVAGIVTRSAAYMPMFYGYLLLLGIGLTVYMIRALRQYRHWLHDNFADLEHKEVRQTFMVLAVLMLMIGYYLLGDDGLAYGYLTQMCGIVLICYLLWRVETLSDLSISNLPHTVGEVIAATVVKESDGHRPSDDNLAASSPDEIGHLLQQHCIDTQLYLQHDLTVTQLALALGTNRLYLSQYFSRHDTTYNAYISDLRIRHFVNLYREAVATRRPFTARQLAGQSGYRSYSTFSLAFKQRMGQSVKAWMRKFQ